MILDDLGKIAGNGSVIDGQEPAHSAAEIEEGPGLDHMRRLIIVPGPAAWRLDVLPLQFQ
jgi:hypothetical protein